MKRWIIALALIICALSMCGCTQAKLPEGMTEEEVDRVAKQVLSYVHEKDYDTLWQESSKMFQDAVSVEELRDAIEGQVKDLGAFKEYTQQAFGGAHAKGVTGHYAVAVITAKYENGKAVYTLSFDTEYRLAGIYVK
ncbi:MAG: DUF3887 domain-containing protein [Lachnospiraceae bacterium]|nr:DUF3887 domain-containing protein [Lachnospiraceae bacterium]MBR0154266.1 DUF3887 domain-containing protein [Lachnospiraceae bacterium]